MGKKVKGIKSTLHGEYRVMHRTVASLQCAPETGELYMTILLEFLKKEKNTKNEQKQFKNMS